MSMISLKSIHLPFPTSVGNPGYLFRFVSTWILNKFCIFVFWEVVVLGQKKKIYLGKLIFGFVLSSYNVSMWFICSPSLFSTLRKLSCHLQRIIINSRFIHATCTTSMSPLCCALERKVDNHSVRDMKRYRDKKFSYLSPLLKVNSKNNLPLIVTQKDTNWTRASSKTPISTQNPHFPSFWRKGHSILLCTLLTCNFNVK